MTLNNLNNNTNCVAEIKEADVLQNSMKQMKIQTDSSEVAVDDCGLPCVKLKFFNMFRSPKWFLVFLCMAATIQGLCINGLVNVVITSIERRFGLKSTQSGIIASSYDIGSLIIMVPVSYFGGRQGVSKPRWISVGMVCLGIGSLVWTIPHFATPAYNKHAEVNDDGSSSAMLCIPGAEHEDGILCDQESQSSSLSLSNYRYLFILGQILHGFGAAPLITLGTTFLDDSVSVRSSSVYIGIFQTFFLIGPAIGFVLGGQLLSLHTDFITYSGLTSYSSLWVGAWWPGFLLSAAWALICGLCILCYPSNINKKKKSPTSDTNIEVDADKKNMFKTLSDEFLSLMKNATYGLLCVAVAIDAIIVSGMASFLPKYFEQQYGMTTGSAGMMVGLLIVPAGGLATFLSGLFLKKFIKSRNGAITQCITAHSINLPLIFAFLMSCPNLPYVGVNYDPVTKLISSPSSSLSTSSLSLSCNIECSCSDSTFDPVCGSDGLMYISPCQAGCSSSQGPNNFTSCSCIDDQQSSAVRELCERDCGFFIPFIVIIFVMMFLTFWVTMPSTMATLRCVKDKERSLAVGLQTMAIRLLGSIPGPVLFGYFIDRTCIQWDSSCDESGQGSCLLYNNWEFSVFMCSCCIVAKLISLFFFIMSLVASRMSDIPDVTRNPNQNKSELEVHVNQSCVIEEDGPTKTQL